MRNKYNRIIKEEIDRFIKSTINEINNNIFQILEKYRIDIVKRYKELQNTMDKYNALNNNEINGFIKNLSVFTIQLESALKRCISSQSLNEGLRDYGINPPEQFSNVVNDFKYWYNWSKRNLFGKQGYGGYGNASKSNLANAREEKLNVLLSNNLYKIERQYNLMASRYGNSFTQISNAPANIIQDAKDIAKQIQRNAQGTNP